MIIKIVMRLWSYATIRTVLDDGPSRVGFLPQLYHFQRIVRRLYPDNSLQEIKPFFTLVYAFFKPAPNRVVQTVKGIYSPLRLVFRFKCLFASSAIYVAKHPVGMGVSLLAVWSECKIGTTRQALYSGNYSLTFSKKLFSWFLFLFLTNFQNCTRPLRFLLAFYFTINFLLIAQQNFFTFFRSVHKQKPLEL